MKKYMRRPRRVEDILDNRLLANYNNYKEEEVESELKKLNINIINNCDKTSKDKKYHNPSIDVFRRRKSK